MRLLPIFSALLLAVGGTSAQAQCSAHQVIGKVEWQRGGSAFRPLRTGQQLGSGDELRTGVASRLRLRCSDGSQIVVADQSLLRIERFEAPTQQPRWAQLWLKRGLVEQQVSPSAGGRWQVRTPTAVTAVRGTRFLVEVDAQQSTLVQVSEGEVAVASLKPPAAASEADADYASKALASLLPPLILNLSQPLLRCGASECVNEAPDAKRLQALRKRLG